MWFNRSTRGGSEMEDEEWNTAFVRTLGVRAERGYDVRDFYSRPIHDDTFLMLLNAHHEDGNSYFRAKKRFAGS